MSTEAKSAVLALFTNHAVTASRRDKLIDAAKQQLDTLVSHRKQAPYRAIALGMLLHQLKAGCKHGEWTPLYQQILKSSKFVTETTAQTYCSQWMRLATEALIQADVATPEFIALAGSKPELSIESSDSKERAFVGKLEKFIGGRSLDELLSDLNLRNVAEKKKRKLARDGGDDGDEKAAHPVTVQDRFNELDQALQTARKGAADKALWMSLTKQQHEDLRAAAEATADFITNLYVKTHGRKKA